MVNASTPVAAVRSGGAEKQLASTMANRAKRFWGLTPPPYNFSSSSRKMAFGVTSLPPYPAGNAKHNRRHRGFSLKPVPKLVFDGTRIIS